MKPFWIKPQSAQSSHMPDEKKSSRIAPLLYYASTSQSGWTSKNTAQLIREGYHDNPIVFRSIRMIAETASSISWLLYEGGREYISHPLLRLLNRPNARMSGVDMLERIFTHLLVDGNAYIEMVSLEGEPRELYPLRPDRVSIIPGHDGWPSGYEYTINGRTTRILHAENELPAILHLTLFDPLDDHYGYAPIKAASKSIDLHNASADWNKALLDNAARPSGALVYNNEGANLTDDQFERLRDELEENFQGAINAGRPLLLEGGLSWTAMSMTPKDMDFLAARREAARDIALTLGVPPLSLGIPGDNSYANYQEANRAFWRLTLLPLLRKTGTALANWLGAAFSNKIGEEIRLEVDLDKIEALSSERDALWNRIAKADFLNDDEKRAALGYGSRQPIKQNENA